LLTPPHKVKFPLLVPEGDAKVRRGEKGVTDGREGKVINANKN